MQFDLAIVGGGLVGASLALSLRESGLRIAIVDARLPSAKDHRLIALNISNIQLLQEIGIWPVLLPKACAIEQVHVSVKGHFGAVRLQAKEMQLPALGYVVPGAVIECALNEALAQQNNITHFRPAILKELTESAESVRLLLKNGEEDWEISAAFVVGADGAESTVRKQLNLPVETHDYRQTAIVTRTLLARGHQHIAYERFNAAGAIAMLPLIDDECATIWTIDNTQLPSLLAMSDEEFLRELQGQFGYRLGKLKAIRQRFTYPLRMVRAKAQHHQTILLLGNAAHAVHPIAAQGFNLALYEIALLAAGINNLVREGKKLAAARLLPVLQHIEEQQKVSIGVTHRLATWLHQPSLVMDTLLPVGLAGFDILLPAKRKFLQEMLGLSRHSACKYFCINRGENDF